MFIAVLYKIAKNLKQPKFPSIIKLFVCKQTGTSMPVIINSAVKNELLIHATPCRELGLNFKANLKILHTLCIHLYKFLERQN